MNVESFLCLYLTLNNNSPVFLLKSKRFRPFSLFYSITDTPYVCQQNQE
jgi:hypothetical protein